MSGNKNKILIVDCDAENVNFLKSLLEKQYRVLCAGDCRSAELLFSSHLPELVIIETALPDTDGTAFIAAVRRFSAAPVIVLSAREAESDKVRALDLGANDYVTKPFSAPELSARIRAVLRSSRRGAELAAVPGGKYISGDLIIDYDWRRVTVSGRDVGLTRTEYNILAFLSQHTDRVMSYSAMVSEIWGIKDFGSIKRLQVNISNIRRKLGELPGENKYILNEPGVGYRMK